MVTKAAGVTPLVVQKKLLDSFNSVAERKKLDTTRLHFVPIDIDTFRKTLSHVAYDINNANDYGIELNYDKLANDAASYIEARHANKLYIGPGGSLTATGKKGANLDTSNINDILPAVVYHNNKIIGALYSGYSAAYEGIFRGFFSTDDVISYLSGARYDIANEQFAKNKGKSKGISRGFDVGHLFSQESTLGDTPLKKSLQTLLDTVESLSNSAKLSPAQQTQISGIKSTINSSLNKLSERSSYGAEVTTSFHKDVSDTLISVGAIVVIAQDRLENQYEYGNLIEGALGAEIRELLKQVQFSPSFLEEVHTAVVSKLSGIPVKGFSKQVKLPKTKTKSKKSKSITTDFVTTKPSKLKKIPDTKPAVDTSLISLQALLDKHLQDVISANMGNGGSKRILNYRTGRLAASAKVERLTQSREGFITAYYTYMKNPYATFSEGGRQQYPRSRDPKLLISKSIREIAQTMAVNRLRAVNV